MNQTDNTITTRAEALAQGLKKYFTGKPCPHGHNTYRDITSGKCIACDAAYKKSDAFKIVSKTYRDKPHVKQRTQAYQLRPSYKASQNNARLKREYNITLDQRNEMIAAQGNRCACCEVPFDPSNKANSPQVDHNHGTNKVRAILCHSCNTGIGKAKEDIYILKSWIDYLRRHNVTA